MIVDYYLYHVLGDVQVVDRGNFVTGKFFFCCFVFFLRVENRVPGCLSR